MEQLIVIDCVKHTYGSPKFRWKKKIKLDRIEIPLAASLLYVTGRVSEDGTLFIGELRYHQRFTRTKKLWI
jgi:hypothetical protein